jgi:cytoskeletal protein RodZ
VGAALTAARDRRGLTIDEAARDTRVRPELLRALEAEDFDELPGDVYVRGTLRTYGRYLGLDPEKVVALYAGASGDLAPPGPPPTSIGSSAPVAHTRLRDSQRLVLLGAVTLLVLAIGLGIVSRQRTAPPPGTVDAAAQQPELDRQITADVVAKRDAEVTVTIDGAAPRTSTLAPGEALSFAASSMLEIRIADGGSIELTVNGRDIGTPGVAGSAWSRTYSFESEGASPSLQP